MKVHEEEHLWLRQQRRQSSRLAHYGGQAPAFLGEREKRRELRHGGVVEAHQERSD